MNTIADSYNYNDLASLNSITKMGQEDEAAALKQVARQFESMFVTMMLKSMRDANAVFEEGNPLNSNESKFYRQMFDDQLALSLTKGQGIGLSESIYRQLKEQLDVEADDDSIPDKDVPIRQYSGVSPFSVTTKDDSTEQVVPAMPLHTRKVEVVEPDSKKSITKQSAFEGPREFVQRLWPVAQQIGQEMGVEPKAIMAQAALETGWGKYIIHNANGSNSHNLFGIKADQRWSGEVAKVSTLEYRGGVAKKEVAPFRSYDSYEESLRDYAKFVTQSSRYEQAVSDGQSVKGYSEGLQNGGYATDPQYAKKIQRIANGDVLNSAISLVKRG